VPREFSKKAIVRDMLFRTGGATLEEIMAETGWQKARTDATRGPNQARSGWRLRRLLVSPLHHKDKQVLVQTIGSISG
jgi:hypothetical protein